MNNSLTESRLLSVDPSLCSSGWVLFKLPSAQILAAGTVTSDYELDLNQRLRDLQSRITSIFSSLQLNSNDFLVCEGPAPIMLNPKTAIKVEQVRGIFETIARSYQIAVPGRINPRSVHIELLGLRGKQTERKIVKNLARQTALTIYRPQLTRLGMSDDISQDIIDALLVGTLAISRINLMISSKVINSQVMTSKEAVLAANNHGISIDKKLHSRAPGKSDKSSRMGWSELAIRRSSAGYAVDNKTLPSNNISSLKTRNR